MITYFTHTEPGGHAENQDGFRVSRLADASCGYLCAVADGQGGRAGAALAAALACQTCIEKASSFSHDHLLSPQMWTPILRQSDAAVAAAENAGYTTLIGFCLTENANCGGSSGDSAVLLRNAGQRPRILTEGQAKNPPVGSSGVVFVPFASPLVSPWTVLAMTDGVWKYADWESVLAASAEGTAEAIFHKLRAKAALPRTGCLQDDFTLAIFQG